MRFIRLGILVLIVGGVIVGWFVFRDQLTGFATDLKTGDCFDVPAADTVKDVQHHPCTDPHDGEVFVVRDYAGSGDVYPTLDQFEAWVRAECIDKDFVGYVGSTFDARPDLSVGYFYPKADGWKSGDRGMVCYLTPEAGGKVTASYRKPGS